MIMIMKKSTILFFISLVFLTSCGEKSEQEETKKVSEHTLYVNSFISEVMKNYYLWNTRMPNFDISEEFDSKEYFNKLLVEEDRYSFISDDADGLLNSLDGVEKTYGYGLTLTWADRAQTYVYAIVDYVYPDSPAAKAGIMRGDIIESMNGAKITEKNVNDLINTSSITLRVSKYSDGDLINGKSVSLSSATMDLNPILYSTVYTNNSKKVGYLMYMSYIEKYNDEINQLFADFKTQDVNEFILDLRYNGGGNDLATTNLCSNLAPQSNVVNKDVVFIDYYNSILTQYFKEKGTDPKTYFDETHLESNLDLKTIYILTSGQTASASEATILALKPYMNVVCIGEATYGKNTSMAVLQPWISETALDPKIKNWVLLPVIAEFKNKNGESSKGKIFPRHKIETTLPFYGVGSTSDPLIAKALELIQGVRSSFVKSAGNPLNAHGHLASKYDKLKSNRFITIQ